MQAIIKTITDGFYAVSATPMFGFFASVAAFCFAKKLSERANTPAANPLIISVLFIFAFYFGLRIPIKNYTPGGEIVYMFLAPATAALALSMYRRKEDIRRNLIPIIIGSLAGVVISVGGVIILCHLFGIDRKIMLSLVPKSVTTAIASELAEKIGGYSSIAAAGVFVTGLFGAIMCPYFTKWFKIKNPTAVGLGIGASCHALGTSQAIKMGETEGAMGGIAIGVCGLLTVVAAMFV